MEMIPEEEISDEGRQARSNKKKKKKSGLLFYSSLHYQQQQQQQQQRQRQQQQQQMLLKASSTPPIARPVPTPEVKLAAIAVDLNIRLRSANMPVSMQERAFRLTRTLVNNPKTAASPATIPNNSKNHPKISPTQIAHAIKKEFDAAYGPAWHCIVGKSFGSFVTHSPGGFLYFTLDNNLSLLLFKTEVRPLINEK